MTVAISIPKLGMSMSERTLSEWLVEDGEVVEVGSLLYVVETDKTQVDIESPAAGTVRLVGEEGETYPVGTLVAEIEPTGGAQ
ncbi:biotin/lipoyl-containing protein [Mycolicibacterium hodleri]|uniref:Dihydrolipoamide acyltransferase n=1 Tax=Mycolicibacterium hodleri TaxID=49897 RepID=A0A502EFK1_9MYCO|nr:biotin/lipoyl-containing protein [Mycolicibacterium hodleri]TPG36458.1 dihydrolipoamide acyltransferase [Mycolicibacterium hodleri]